MLSLSYVMIKFILIDMNSGSRFQTFTRLLYPKCTMDASASEIDRCSSPTKSIEDDDNIKLSRDWLSNVTSLAPDPDGSKVDSSLESNADPDDGEVERCSSRVSTASEISGLSDMSCASELNGLSDMSSQGWSSPTMEPLSWIQRHIGGGADPRLLLSKMTGQEPSSLDGMSDITLWKIIISYLNESPRRLYQRPPITLDEVVSLLQKCNKIIILTGAGVSVSCGIPDFRSKNGVYARLAEDFPDLPNPQAMFDIVYFHHNPKPFFTFAKEIYPGQFKPSPCHRFIKLLEKRGKLLRNYTQNIDTLEKVAGIENVIECHGSFATASCTKCHQKVDAEDIRSEIFQQKIPYCKKCPSDGVEETEKGIMKPDIVFFGEDLPQAFCNSINDDKDECDLLIVIGSSLKVQPVALIPDCLPDNVPQILINREVLIDLSFNVELLGDSDVIIDHLCRRLGDGWEEICWMDSSLTDITDTVKDSQSTTSVASSESDVPEESGIDENSENKEVLSESVEDQGADGKHIVQDCSRDSGIGQASNSSSDSLTSQTTETPITVVPEGCFLMVKKGRYVFPGAEL